MACEHKRLKSVNCVMYCMDCGARLDTVEVSTILGETQVYVVGVDAEAKKPAKKIVKKKTGKEDGEEGRGKE